MKILIVYAGKTGTTEKCARVLEQKLKNVTVVNIDKQEVDITKYDLIIIGSSIRMGLLHKKIKKFISTNKDVLLNKQVAYYICCGFSLDYKDYFKNNIPKELLDSSIIYSTFGGELDIKKQRGFDKFVVNLISKTDKGKQEIKILNENIELFVQKVKEI